MTEIIINSCNFDAKELSPNLNISIEKTTTVITKNFLLVVWVNWQVYML